VVEASGSTAEGAAAGQLEMAEEVTKNGQ